MPSPPRSTAWCPLLEGELCARARQAVAAIAADLERGAAAVEGGLPGHNASLAGGDAGIALFHAYRSLDAGEEDGEADAEAAVRRFDDAAEGIAGSLSTAGLYAGFSGVAWVQEHLEGRLFDSDGEDMGEEIDRALLAHLEASPWPWDYDLISGLAGFGVYALERLAHPSGGALLERVVERLGEIAQRDGGEVTWFTPPHLLAPPQREQAPEGYYNVGLAHGVPGVIPVLAAASAAGVAAATARPLLDGAVRWVLGRRLPPASGVRFPTSLRPDGVANPSRLAWCYGDPGVALSLLVAARLVDEPAWESEAMATLLASTRLPAEEAGVRDAGLCHGSAGLAHLYNRAYQATGEEALAAAARSWYTRTLDGRQAGRGVGGYTTWGPAGADLEMGWQTDPGFLTGSAGIGLALLAGSSEVEPEWDRVLEVSVPD